MVGEDPSSTVDERVSSALIPMEKAWTFLKKSGIELSYFRNSTSSYLPQGSPPKKEKTVSETHNKFTLIITLFIVAKI